MQEHVACWNGEHLGKESKYVGMVVVLQQSKKMYNVAV